MWSKYVKSRRAGPSGDEGFIGPKSPPIPFNMSSNNPTEHSPPGPWPLMKGRSDSATLGAIFPYNRIPVAAGRQSPLRAVQAQPGELPREGNAGSKQVTTSSSPPSWYPPGTAIGDDEYYEEAEQYYVYDAAGAADLGPADAETGYEMLSPGPYSDARVGAAPVPPTQAVAVEAKMESDRGLRQNSSPVRRGTDSTVMSSHGDECRHVVSYPVSYNRTQGGAPPIFKTRSTNSTASREQQKSPERHHSRDHLSYSISYRNARPGTAPVLRAQTAHEAAIEDGHKVIGPSYSQVYSHPGDISPLSTSKAGDEMFYAVPYNNARLGAPPVFRSHTEPKPYDHLDPVTRIQLANKQQKGHKASKSLPSGGSRTPKLQKRRRALTGELMRAPSWGLKKAASDITPPLPSPVLQQQQQQQQQRLQQQWHGSGTSEDDSSAATPPRLETARAAVPMQLRRSFSVPLPGNTTTTTTTLVVNSSSDGVNFEMMQHKPLPVLPPPPPTSHAILSQRDSGGSGSVDSSQPPTPSARNESPIMSHATYMSDPRSSPDKPRESVALEYIKGGRPTYLDYAPMSPYAEWDETLEPSEVPELSGSSIMTKDIPAEAHSGDDGNGRRGEEESDDGRVGPLSKTLRTPTLTLSTEGTDWRSQQQEQQEQLLQDRENKANRRSTIETIPEESFATWESAMTGASSPTLTTLTNSRKVNHVDSAKGQQGSREGSMMVSTPAALDEDDVIKLYWDSHSEKPEYRPQKASKMATARTAAASPSVQSWDTACQDYFLAKYRDRLTAESWKNEPFREAMGVDVNPEKSKFLLPQHLYAQSDRSGDEDILPYLLNDRLFFLALTLSASLKGQYARQLWELFGTNPGHLLSVYSALSAANRPRDTTGSMGLGQYLASVIDAPARAEASSREDGGIKQHSFDSMMDKISRELDGLAVSPNEMVLYQIKSQLRRLQLELRSRPALSKCWVANGPEPDGSGTSPLYHGLQQYLASHRNVLDRALRHANDQLADLSSLLGAADRPFPMRESPAPMTDVTLVFDAPGSGKTRCLRDKILETGGLYFLSPNLPDTRPAGPSKDGSRIGPGSSRSCSGSASSSPEHAPNRPVYGTYHEAHLDRPMLSQSRNYASRDTHTLYQDLSCLEVAGIDAGGGSSGSSSRSVLGTHRRPQDRLLDTDICVGPLLHARRYMLDNMPGLRNPIRWLQLQMMASDPDDDGGSSFVDVFDIAYRFFRLSPRWGEQDIYNHQRQRSESTQRHTHLSDISSVVPICIDEGQAILGDHLAERIVQGLIDSHRGHAYIATTSLKTLPSIMSPRKSGTMRQSTTRLSTPAGQRQGLMGRKKSHGKSASGSSSLSVDRVSSSRTNVGNAETFWSVLLHHAWSIVSELFELQNQHQHQQQHDASSPMKSFDDGVQAYSPGSRQTAASQGSPLLARDGEALGFTIDLGPFRNTAGNTALSSGESWEALERDLLANWTVFAPDSRDETIQAECSRFFGRVRWTATFTEELLRCSASSSTAVPDPQHGYRHHYHHDLGGRLTRNDIEAASNRAADRIKAAAMRRMRDLGGTSLLHEFLAKAVEVDARGVSGEFVGDVAAQLVAAGLALVYDSDVGSVASVVPGLDVTSDPTNPRYARARLAEPLVVEAALEYIRQVACSAQDGLGGGGCRRYWLPESLSISSVGDVTGRNMVESAVTSAIKPLLNFPFDEIALHRRSAFLAIMQSAEAVPAAPTRDSVGNLAARLRRSTSPPRAQQAVAASLGAYLSGALGRYQLFDSGLDVGCPGDSWTAEEWLLAQHTTASTSNNSFYQGLPNFFFVPDVENDRQGNAGGGLGSCIFFLADCEEMSSRIMCVVQFPQSSSRETTRRVSACSSAVSPRTTRAGSLQWSTSPAARLVATAAAAACRGDGDSQMANTRTEQLRQQIQLLLPQTHCDWPVVYISVAPRGGDGPDAARDDSASSHHHLSPAAAGAGFSSKKAAAGGARLMDPSRQLALMNTRGQYYPHDSRDSYEGSRGGGSARDQVAGDRAGAAAAAAAQRPSFCVQVDEETFAKVCGESLMKIVVS